MRHSSPKRSSGAPPWYTSSKAVDAADLVRAVGSTAVRVLADTYHMDIEEDDPCASLRAGAGHVPFEAIDGWAETA